MTYSKLCRAVSATCLLVTCFADRADAQKLYWAQRGGDPSRVWRSDVDGTGVEVLLTSQLPSPTADFRDVAVDHHGGFIYLADGLGTVIRAGLNGENPTTIVPGTSSRIGIAVDPTHDKLYFTSSSPYQIESANLDGSDVRTVLDGYTNDLAVDPEAGYLFTTRITRAGLDGQNPVTIVPGGNGIALDPIAQKIYWTDGPVEFPCCGNPIPPEPGHVYRANYDGSAIETVIGRTVASEIAVDPIRGMIYWYDPINLHILSATTDGVVVSDDLLDREIELIEGLAIDYIIPEPGTLGLAALAATALFIFRLRRRSKRPCSGPAS